MESYLPGYCNDGVGIQIEFPESVDLDPIELSFGSFVGANIERLELEAIIRGMNEVLELFESYHNDKLKNVNTIIITTDRYGLNNNEKTSPFRIKDWRKNNWHNHEGKEEKVKFDAVIIHLNIMPFCVFC